MNWTEILVAAITGGLAVLGQYFLNRRQDIEKELKDSTREQNQNERLDKIEKQLNGLHDTVNNLNAEVAKQTSRIDKQEQAIVDLCRNTAGQGKQIDKLEDTINKQQISFNLQQASLNKMNDDLADNNLRTMRLDLLHAIESDPENQMVILEMARKYFGEMHGNCYMSKVFQDWADAHNVSVINILNGGTWTS